MIGIEIPPSTLLGLLPPLDSLKYALNCPLNIISLLRDLVEKLSAFHLEIILNASKRKSTERTGVQKLSQFLTTQAFLNLPL